VVAREWLGVVLKEEERVMGEEGREPMAAKEFVVLGVEGVE
jgi:hypothetical protein